MIEALSRHWRVYLMEAAGLAFFMIPAAVMTLALEHPESSLHRAIGSTVLRHAVLGLVLGLVIAFIIYNPWGKRSGAHINPGVTLVFLRLGRIDPWDAFFYIAAQFAGGIGAAFLMKALLGEPFEHPDVMASTTRPGFGGVAVAFAAEFVISFVFMLVVLIVVHNARLEPHLGWIAAILIALYLTVETPLSGMSLNPARSFGSALAAHEWSGLWLYFVAPPVAMLGACEVWIVFERRLSRYCAQRLSDDRSSLLLCEQTVGPTFPAEAKP